MVAITASIKEDLLILIFLWIQNVVTASKIHEEIGHQFYFFLKLILTNN